MAAARSWPARGPTRKESPWSTITTSRCTAEMAPHAPRFVAVSAREPEAMDRPELLARGALLARLDRAFGVRLTTVIAGAGLRQVGAPGRWVADLRCAWHSVASRDHAVVSLADGVVAALGRALPELAAGLPVPAFGRRSGRRGRGEVVGTRV